MKEISAVYNTANITLNAVLDLSAFSIFLSFYRSLLRVLTAELESVGIF